MRPADEVISGSDQEIPLPERPSALLFEDLHRVSDPQIVGTFQGQYIIAGSGLESLGSLPQSELMAILAYTHEHNLSSAHLSLVDSWLTLIRCTTVICQQRSFLTRWSVIVLFRGIFLKPCLKNLLRSLVVPSTKKIQALPHMSVLKQFLSLLALGVFRLSGCLPVSGMAPPRPGW